MSGTSLKWVQSTLPTSAYWGSVTYGDGKFVAVTSDSSTGSTVAAYSTDGITWNQTTLPTSANWVDLTYGDGKFIAVTGSLYNDSTVTPSSTAAYSTDGITWTQTTLPTSAYWSSVTYGDGKFVAVTRNSTAAAYSTDGITWTQTTLPIYGIWSLAYGNGKFVIVAFVSSRAAYSTDGITWTQTSIPYGNWDGLTYGNGKFVAVQQQSATAAYSTDGISWTQTTLPTSDDWYGLTYGNDRFVTTTISSSKSAYSTDGITWTQTTLPIYGTWSSVTYGDGKFVAVNSPSKIAAYSTEVPQYTFTITPAPSDATVTLTATGFTQSGNSIVVDEGTTVSYAVSKEGYVTKTGTNAVTADYTLEVRLVREDITAGFSSVDLSKFSLSVGNTVCIEGTVPTPEPSETVVTLTSGGQTITSKTGGYIKGSTVLYNVFHPYFTPTSGSTRIIESETIDVTINEFTWYTLTINPSQSGSTITFSSVEGYQSGTNTYRVHDGSSITYKVEKVGYVTMSDTVVLSQDTTIDVTQSLTWTVYSGDSYTGEQSTDANYDLGLDA